MDLKVNTFLLIFTNLQVCHCYTFWLKAISEFDGKQLCLLKNDDFDSNDTDNIVVDLAELQDKDVYVSEVDNVESLFDYCDISARSVIVILNQDEVTIRKLFSTASQANLKSNVWIFGNFDKDYSSAIYTLSSIKRRLSLRIKVFALNLDTLETHQILGTAAENQNVERLGNFVELNLREILEETEARSNFNGIKFYATLGDYPPYCVLSQDGSTAIGGLYPDILKTVEANYNLSIIIRPPQAHNINVWGTKLPNGTFTGMFGEVVDGIVDTTIAGHTVTKERGEVVVFTNVGFQTIASVIIRTPSPSDPGVHYHTLEFKENAWIALASIYIGIWLLVSLMLLKLRHDPKVFDTITDSLGMCARFFISKGSSVTYPKVSYRIGFFSLLIMGMMVLIAYRCQLNAGLNVKIIDVPIKTWEDVLASDKKFLIWMNTTAEDYFANNPPGSTKRRIYEEKILTSGSGEHINGIGYDGSTEQLINGTSLLYIEIDPYVARDEYPCQIMDVKKLRRYIKLALPFHPDSPFFEIFDEHMLKMKVSGMLTKYLNKYETVKDKCTASKNPMGLAQTMLPFFILLLGVAMCVLIAICERTKLVPTRPKQPPKVKCILCGK